MFSDHNNIKLKINDKKSGKSKYLKIQQKHFHNPWVKEEITRVIRKQFKLKNNLKDN